MFLMPVPFELPPRPYPLLAEPYHWDGQWPSRPDHLGATSCKEGPSHYGRRLGRGLVGALLLLALQLFPEGAAAEFPASGALQVVAESPGVCACRRPCWRSHEVRSPHCWSRPRPVEFTSFKL